MNNANNEILKLINTINKKTAVNKPFSSKPDLHSVINLCREIQKTYAKNNDLYFRLYNIEKIFTLLLETLEDYNLSYKYKQTINQYYNSRLETMEKSFLLLVDAIEKTEAKHVNRKSVFIYE